MQEYYWPGNIREMENVIERAVNISDGSQIEPEVLNVSSPVAQSIPAHQGDGSYLEELEKQAIMEVIQEMEGNLSRASKKLGIARSTLYKKIDKYDLDQSV
jgi:DNA-binding NtrC family response regulator